MSISNEQVLEWCKAQYDEIEGEALEVSSDFDSCIAPVNLKKKALDRSTLGIRVRRRNAYSLTFCWIYVRFFRTRDGRWVPRTKEISRGRTERTSADRIKRHACGWEVADAVLAEKRLVILRRRQAIIRRIVHNVRLLQSSLDNTFSPSASDTQQEVGNE